MYGMLKKTTLLLTLSITIAGCSSHGNETREPVKLIDTSWRLISLDGQAPIGNRPLTISFTRVKISGHSGCNNYTYAYSKRGHKLFIDPYSNKASITEMYCPEPKGVMDQEVVFIEQLKNTQKVSVTGDQLILKYGAQSMSFEKM